MRSILLLVFLSAQLVYAYDPPWSKTGHRTIGEIAEKYLSRKTGKALTELLKGRNLATVSNYADEIKADSIYRKYGAWHYVNYPADQRYTDVAPSPYGDVIIGIEKCVEVLRDSESTRDQQEFHLKMLVHLIGDLHQPMHVGRLEDKGGNDIQVRWFDRGTNLHKIWDTHLVEDYGMSYTELAASLPSPPRSERLEIQEGTIYDWVEESQDLANQIYDSVEVGEKLYYRYGYVWWPTVEQQLLRGGIRLAKVLNDIFD